MNKGMLSIGFRSKEDRVIYIYTTNMLESGYPFQSLALLLRLYTLEIHLWVVIALVWSYNRLLASDDLVSLLENALFTTVDCRAAILWLTYLSQ
jgi:hypothetical protein